MSCWLVRNVSAENLQVRAWFQTCLKGETCSGSISRSHSACFCWASPLTFVMPRCFHQSSFHNVLEGLLRNTVYNQSSKWKIPWRQSHGNACILCSVWYHCEICSTAQPNFSNYSLLRMKGFGRNRFTVLTIRKHICVFTHRDVWLELMIFFFQIKCGNFKTLALFLSLTVLSIPLWLLWSQHYYYASFQ